MGNVAVEVHVTKRDIENGALSDPTGCMVALAMRRVVLPSCSVRVAYGDDLSCNEAAVGKGENEKIVMLPLPVANKIEDWDRGDETEPFKFKVKLPEWCLRPSVVVKATSKGARKGKALITSAPTNGKPKTRKVSAR